MSSELLKVFDEKQMETERDRSVGFSLTANSRRCKLVTGRRSQSKKASHQNTIKFTKKEDMYLITVVSSVGKK